MKARASTPDASWPLFSRKPPTPKPFKAPANASSKTSSIPSGTAQSESRSSGSDAGWSCSSRRSIARSNDVARRELKQQGIKLDRKTVRRIATQFGEQLLALRRRELLAFRHGTLESGSEFDGLRIAVAIDGGRVRTRENIEPAEPLKPGERAKFETKWREPKALIYLAR